MKRRTRWWAWVSAGCMTALALPAPGADEANEPAVVKARYQAIASQLEPGGNVYVILNVDGAIEETVGWIAKITAANPGPDAAKGREFMEKLRGFLGRQGLYAVQGLGMSGVPQTPDRNSVRVFLARDPAAADLPLWRAFVGGSARRPASLDMIPADAAAFRILAWDLPRVWKSVRAGVAELAPPRGAAEFEQNLARSSAGLGITVDALVNSLGDEILVSLQLSRDTKIALPLEGGAKLEIPEPSLLVGLKVRDSSLMDTIERQLASNQVPVTVSAAEDTPIKAINLPIPSPIPFQPAWAAYGGFLLVGSNPKVVGDAVRCAKSKQGLAAGEEFRSAFAGLPLVNNGMSYDSARFRKTLVDVQTQFLAADRVGAREVAFPKIIAEWLMPQGTQPEAFVTVNLKDGILTQGFSSQSGRQVLLGLAVAPLGLGAAIAVPSFAKARSGAVRNNCINNLRMLDAAKEQWALEASKKDGDAVEVPAILTYIRGNKMPVCPQGGTYTVNPIGKNPTCSIPQHRLQ